MPFAKRKSAAHENAPKAIAHSSSAVLSELRTYLEVSWLGDFLFWPQDNASLFVKLRENNCHECSHPDREHEVAARKLILEIMLRLKEGNIPDPSIREKIDKVLKAAGITPEPVVIPQPI